MSNLAALIEHYVLAKDCNRPHLLQEVFAPDVSLTMNVLTPAISFPQQTQGLGPASEIVCSHLNQQYENIYTFCFAPRPTTLLQDFACGWLVVMSEKVSKNVRAGGGRYDWRLTADRERVAALRITVSAMDTYAAETLAVVMAWASKQEYPWCDRTKAEEDAASAPALHATLLTLRTFDENLATSGLYLFSS